MNHNRLTAIAIPVLGLALFGGLFFAREQTYRSATPLETTEPSAAASLPPSMSAPSAKSHSNDERVSRSEPIDWSNLRRRLDGMAPRLAAIEVQREANRLLQHWLRSDRNAALVWLSGHRGDPLFDPIAASVAQTLVAVGDFGEAQNLADGIVDPAVGDWVHQEAWAAAYEKGLVTADQIQSSGLPPAAISSVLSGSHRD